jgi:hypothetical protein
MKGEGFIGKSDGVDRVLPRTRVFDRKHDRSANFRTPRRPLRTRRADEKGKVWPQGHGASSPGSSRVRSLRSFSRFVNETMRAARSFSETRELVFPIAAPVAGDRAINALLAIGSRARLKPGPACFSVASMLSFAGCRDCGLVWTQNAANQPRSSEAVRSGAYMLSRQTDGRGACVAAVEHDGRFVLSGGARGGSGEVRQARDFQHRPRLAVHFSGLHRRARRSGRRDLHGRPRPLDGQRLQNGCGGRSSTRTSISKATPTAARQRAPSPLRAIWAMRTLRS